MPATAISTQGLTKRYGKVAAVEGVTTDIESGGVIGLLGPNGAGKTTMMRMLLGLVRPSSGSFSVLGSTDPNEYLQRVGALIEGPAFHPGLSGRKNLIALAHAGAYDRSRIDDLLAQVGLTERANDRVKTYSLGMKQRLGIAAALLPDPELVVLDEPTNGLDPSGIREMREFLRGLGQSGRTVFVSSHNLAEMQRISDRVMVLQHGKVVYAGATSAMPTGQSAAMRMVAEDPTQHEALVTVAREQGMEARILEGHVQVNIDLQRAGELNRAAMAAGITLVEITPRPVDLEESFLAMTREVQA